MFIIEDEIHAETQEGEYATFEEAAAGLQRHEVEIKGVRIPSSAGHIRLRIRKPRVGHKTRLTWPGYEMRATMVGTTRRCSGTRAGRRFHDRYCYRHKLS